MLKSINQWSFPDTMNLRVCFELAKDAGFDGVELVLTEPSEGAVVAGGAEHLALPMTYLGFHPYANDEFTVKSTKKDVQKVKELADELGLRIPSIASVLPFIYPLSDKDPEVRGEGIRIIRTALEFAEILGAETVLVIPGVATPGGSYGGALEVLHGSLVELGSEAEKRGVVLALETVWNQLLLSPHEFAAFIDRFDSDFIKAYIDVGNVLRTGYGQDWLRTLGNRVDKVHFCNFRGEVGNITGFTRHLLDGDVDWVAIMNALSDIGYDGWVTAEITPPAPHYPEKVIYDISSTMDWILAGGRPVSGVAP